MVRRIACMAVMIVLLVSVSVVGADSEKQKAAISEALKWLTVVDQGKYDASWDSAAELFRSAVNKEHWVQSLQSARKPLGDLISRERINATLKTSLPGAPDGQYVVIQFQASFENKTSVIETVTPMLDKDGNWRVSGYYIK